MRVGPFEERMGVVLEDADPHPGPLPKREREHRAINNRELLLFHGAPGGAHRKKTPPVFRRRFTTSAE